MNNQTGSVCGLFGRGVGDQAGFGYLQAVVAGEIDGEVPGHYVVVAQFVVQDHALDAVDGGGHAPGGVAEVAAGLGTTGAKLAQHAGQTLGPVTGAEGFSVARDTLDKDFFGSVGNHQVGLLSRGLVHPRWEFCEAAMDRIIAAIGLFAVLCCTAQELYLI